MLVSYQRAHICINISQTLSLTHNIVLLENKTKNSKFQSEVRYSFTKKTYSLGIDVINNDAQMILWADVQKLHSATCAQTLYHFC